MEPLDSIAVHIRAIQLAEAPAFIPKKTITDQNGNFAFDTIYVGTYELLFYRNNYPVLSTSYFQNYADTSLYFYCPDVYYITASQTLEAYSEFKNYRPAKFSFHPANMFLISLTGWGIHRFKWESSLKQWIHLRSYWNLLVDYSLENTNIAFGKDATYFYLVQKPDNLHKIKVHVDYLETEQTIRLTHDAWDVYCSNDSLYIPSQNQVYIYDETTLSLQRVIPISNQDINISCFYRDNIYFWAADKISGRLYQCDKNMNILRTYATFTKNGKFVIKEMSIDFEKKVWFQGNIE